MVRPGHVFEAGIHHLSRYISPSSSPPVITLNTWNGTSPPLQRRRRSRPRHVDAEMTQALLHHYRKCVNTAPAQAHVRSGSRSGRKEGDEERVQCDVLVKDAAILKYEHELTVASRAEVNAAMAMLANLSAVGAE